MYMYMRLYFATCIYLSHALCVCVRVRVCVCVCACVRVQVDKHIRRLDADLSRFEQELQMKDSGGRLTSTSTAPDSTDCLTPLPIGEFSAFCLPPIHIEVYMYVYILVVLPHRAS